MITSRRRRGEQLMVWEPASSLWLRMMTLCLEDCVRQCNLGIYALGHKQCTHVTWKAAIIREGHWFGFKPGWIPRWNAGWSGIVPGGSPVHPTGCIRALSMIIFSNHPSPRHLAREILFPWQCHWNLSNNW